MELRCEDVLRELNGYLEGGTTSELRARIEAHLRGCHRCLAVYDGVRNVLRLVADGRALELPAGFSERLRRRLVFPA